MPRPRKTADEIVRSEVSRNQGKVGREVMRVCKNTSSLKLSLSDLRYLLRVHLLWLLSGQLGKDVRIEEYQKGNASNVK